MMARRNADPSFLTDRLKVLETLRETRPASAAAARVADSKPLLFAVRDGRSASR